MDGRRAVTYRSWSWSRSRSWLWSQIVFCCCAAVLLVTSINGEVDAREPVEASSAFESRCPNDGCAAANCPHNQEVCLLGLVPDRCGCCANGVCGLAESQECDAISRPCANNLECVKMKDGVGTKTEVLYRCACKEKEMVCGSDNRTYSNVCQLNEAISKLGNNRTLISIQYWGPCQSAPVIKSAPKNFAGIIGQPAVFDCEINGYPVPSINWQFTDMLGITKSLPGDDTLLAIQTRGGPDRHTVSSWVQIMEFKHIHSGNYTCLGTNKVDTVVASAVLDIRKMT
ncbi:insulin-like growth factor-binding protein-related protein 1 [Sipha flava]|uniref:Insulin-like growth factor-binding protein-related protein 1 n=1 Tax=Sipha flava TaxID=143950 RepID=A0A2S2QPP4_9HEMI|nr:insulin-like growth factor-binding protein-related protein 1 [Sipha flava]